MLRKRTWWVTGLVLAGLFFGGAGLGRAATPTPVPNHDHTGDAGDGGQLVGLDALSDVSQSGGANVVVASDANGDVTVSGFIHTNYLYNLGGNPLVVWADGAANAFCAGTDVAFSYDEDATDWAELLIYRQFSPVAKFDSDGVLELGYGLLTDTIDELSANAGVTIDDVLIKDGEIHIENGGIEFLCGTCDAFYLSPAGINLGLDAGHQLEVPSGVVTDVLESYSSAGISCNDEQLKDVADPTAAQDAATKKYVDDHSSGFTPACIFLYKTSTQDLPNNNTWYDVTFGDVDAPVKVGFTHSKSSNPEQITVTAAGVYLIAYSVGQNSGLSNQVVSRVLDDGTEIAGSFTGPSNSYAQPRAHSFLASIGAGSVIELQCGTNVAGTDIVGPDSANAPDPTTRNGASLSIVRIDN